VVQLGNTAPLGEARVPFALYLNHIHNRIHPIFAEEFLRAFDSLPPDHPLNQDLSTLLEIVLEQPTGQLLRMGVVRSSGVAAFDIAALNAMARAQPFGAAPEVIASPDGRVYLHWELHRDPVDACTTRNARPYILKSVP
jgi:TonB family protein